MAPVYPPNDPSSGPGESPGGGGEANVQSDWNQTNQSSDDFIKNKPTIPDISVKQDTIDSSNKVAVKTTLDLNNVDNTGDSSKPVSVPQQAAIDLKVNLTDVVNNLTTSSAGKVADARTVKTLKDQLDEISTELDLETKGWTYQDYSAGSITGTSVTLSQNQNGTNSDGSALAFSSSKIVNTTAFILRSDNNKTVLRNGLTGFLNKVRVTAHSGASVNLSHVPNSSAPIRIWYMYSEETSDIKDRVMPPPSLTAKQIDNLSTVFDTKQDKLLAKDYVDASVTDIKTIIDNWGSAATLVGYNYQLHGTYSGADISINDYYNISFSGTDNPTGSPHTILASRAVTLTGSNCTRIKMTNLNIENGLVINGTQGRHYFEKCIIGGLTVSSTTNWISFIDCTFSGSVNINSNFAGAVYFVRCAFGGQALTLNNTVSTQVVLSDCSGLTSIPNNAFKSGLTSLGSGVGEYYLNNVPFGTASTYDVGTGANNVVALDANSKLPPVDASQLLNVPFSGSSIGFHAKTSAHAQSSGTIVFDSVTYNLGSHYNASTGVFTAPKTGVYLFGFTTLLWTLGYSSHVILRKNGSAFDGDGSLGIYGSFNGTYAGQGGSTTVYLTTGDTVDFYLNYFGTNFHSGYTKAFGHFLG